MSEGCPACGGKGYIGGEKYLRPGPLCQARLLGIWPTATSGVWSDALWRSVLRALPWPIGLLPCGGVDCARFGDDYTAIHFRIGPVSLHHEAHNGWDAAQVVGRLKELCSEWAAAANELRESGLQRIEPEEILVNVDEDGLGGAGVVDHAGGYNFRGVSAASTELCGDEYPNLRSMLWFNAADRARKGRLSLAGLDRDSLGRLQQQLLAPVYKLNGQGQRVVEPKEETKLKLGRSPDDADGMNLAYWEPAFTEPRRVGPERQQREPGRDSAQERRGMFGLGKGRRQ